MSEPSIFTKIINGEIPCHKVYEDDKTIAFLDIHPKTPGHTLVVSKVEIDHLWDLADEDYLAVMSTVRKVSNRIRGVLQPVRVGLQVEGMDVPHAHVHVFPFATHAEFHAMPDLFTDPDHVPLADMAQKLAF